MSAPDWLELRRGSAPLIVSLPHTGTLVPEPYRAAFADEWLARKDTDWHIEKLYDFAAELDATILRTEISRSIIDVNRDPSGASLYPGQATTELCPNTTFDGEPLYRGGPPSPENIAERRIDYFEPYHAALAAEIARLRAVRANIVVYDCHSIRSVIPRLFEGELPQFNIGTNSAASCDPALTAAIEVICRASGRETVVNGRFKGGHITRSTGAPACGVHAVQMELACRAYLREPIGAVSPANWPPTYDAEFAAPIRSMLKNILQSCLDFAARQ